MKFVEHLQEMKKKLQVNNFIAIKMKFNAEVALIIDFPTVTIVTR